MFRTIYEKIQRDRDYPERQYTISIFNRVRDGALYDHLEYGFHQEREGDQYIQVRERRPSVRHNLCRIVADDASSLLFSESHFPTIYCDDDAINDGVASLVKHVHLNEIMVTAAITGSVGSVAIHMRVMKQKDETHRPFYDVHSTEFLTPTFDPFDPESLVLLTEKYKVIGGDLDALGYKIDQKYINSWFWFQRVWDKTTEIWFIPKLVQEESADEAKKPPVKDKKRSVQHNLGFVPWVWIRNLPGKLRLLPESNRSSASPRYSGCDGSCTFAAAIDTMIEIDYLLSQGSRGLKYSMDPTMMVKEPAAPMAEDFTKSPDSALLVSAEGDAKLLEISGSAFTVVLEYAKGLRELGLENIHGNRAEGSKLSTAQSGRAMELMNQALIWLADKMRISYGEGAIRKLLFMTFQANLKYPIHIQGRPLVKVPDSTEFELRWPRWYSPTYGDRRDMAMTLQTHAEAGHISRETAVETIAPDYDIADVQKELGLIKQDADEASARLIKEQAQVRAKTSVPS